MQFKFRLLCLFGLLFWLACIPEFINEESKPFDLKAKVIYLKDGDSFVVLHNKQEIQIRLRAIDAPELHQPHGKRAKEYLSRLIKGKIVGIDYSTRDKYGRLLANVYLDSLYINYEMVNAGYAWNYTQFSNDKDLQEAEEKARGAQIGLWQDAYPIAPWEWRSKKIRR